MITLRQALGWLNQLDPSHLSEKSQYLLWEITETSLPEAEKENRIDTLTLNARAMSDPYEFSEVQVNCAWVQAERGQSPQAIALLKTAERFYEQRRDRVRQAVTRWMMSLIEWKQLDHLAAHSDARCARELLQQVAHDLLLERKDHRLKWVQDRIYEMDEDLASTPEEAFHWMNQFEESRLSPPARQIAGAINEALKAKLFPQAYNEIDSLLRITRGSADPLETAESMAYCGLVNAQMGNTKEAIRLMRQASAQFLPESHRKASILWMLAMTLFIQPLETNQAVKTCNQSIDMMESLKGRATQRNRPGETEWYRQRAEIMRAILNKKIRGQERTARP